MMTTPSCKSLMNAQEQPVNVICGKNNIYMTTRSRIAETIGSCFKKAQKTCDKGYHLIEEKIDSSCASRDQIPMQHLIDQDSKSRTMSLGRKLSFLD